MSRADEPLQVTQAGGQLFGEQACGKGPRLLGGSKLDIGQKCAPGAEAAKGILGCMSRNRASYYYLCSTLTAAHLHTMSSCQPTVQEDIRELETIQQKPPLWRELEHLCCEEKLG